MPPPQSPSELDFIIVEPKNCICDATIIWLHGLGADGNDFVDIVSQLGLPATHKIRFIFPHAPYRDVTINGGMSMRAWYDLYSLEFDCNEDIAGIMQAKQYITTLIEQEIAAGISAKRIILAGFSQGGALALYIGLRFNEALGGIIVLSAYELLPLTLHKERPQVNKAIPIFMAHGMFDPVVPFHLGRECYEHVLNLDCPVKWQAYPMQHTVVAEEIQHIGSFIKEVLRVV